MINNKHQFLKRILPTQPNKTIVQILPTSGYAPNMRAASVHNSASQTRMSPIDPKADIPGNPTRPTSDRNGKWRPPPAQTGPRPIWSVPERPETAPRRVPPAQSNTAGPPHQSTTATPIQFEPAANTRHPRPNTLRPGLTDHKYSSIPPRLLERQKQEETTGNQQEPLEKRTPQVIRQDKRRLTTARPRLSQPAADTNCTRAAGPYNGGVRSQNKSEEAKTTGRITIWGVGEPLKAGLERIAVRDGISLSAVGLALIRRAIQEDIDLHYTATLEPMFERILQRYLNSRDTRVISLLVRIAFDSGQTRSIVTNILGLQPDISPDLLRDIIQESDKRAKSNIIKKTPQISELTQALEKWFFEQAKAEATSN